MKRKRSSTVEPVWGTLINYLGMKRINAKGLAAANKTLILAATCYNLKKWLKFVSPKGNIKIMTMLQTNAREVFELIKKVFTRLIARQNATVYFLAIRHY
jgi:hypothetical protein